MPKRKNKQLDKVLLFAFVAIIVIGIVALLSASAGESNRNFKNIYEYFLHQFTYGFIIGGILCFVMYKFPYKKLEKLALPIFLLSVFAMMLIFVPGLGLEIGGAKRWLNLGFATFQPSELIKLAFVIYFSAWLSSHIKEVRSAKSFIPFIVLLGSMGFLLMLQPDLSTLGIVVAIAGAMYFTAGAKIREMAAIGGIGVAALYLFVKISPYRINRVKTLLDPRTDPFGIGYQINQILIAVGSGQIWGAGPFQGTQKNFLPLAMNDSIYAVWAEETGFIGAAIVILLFMIVAWRGMRIASNASTDFAKFAAAGITTWLFIQAVINMGAMIGIIPLTGVTLPLISYGSSSLIVTLMAVGLLLQLSKEVNKS